MAEVEIITRRRRWTAEEKAVLLAEVAAEGGRVAMVARRHGLSQSLLYNWRSVARATVPRHAPEPVEFQPVGVIGRTKRRRCCERIIGKNASARSRSRFPTACG